MVSQGQNFEKQGRCGKFILYNFAMFNFGTTLLIRKTFFDIGSIFTPESVTAKKAHTQKPSSKGH